MASLTETMLDAFGIRKMPWVARAYLLLAMIFIGVLTFAAFGPQAFLSSEGEPTPLVTRLFDLTTDLLKLVLGAFLGSLSMAAERTLGDAAKLGDK